jgi:DNA-binding winged helix-turn-helix (wHTH) protein
METVHMQHVVYLFDRFQLDVTRRKLLSAGGLVLRLNSRAMEALLLLVANAGQVVERRRLMQAIWPDTVVEDNNLNQCILAIRKALGETAGSNEFVMTVQGRGFCFVCPVHTRIQESSGEPAAAAFAPPAAPSRRRLRRLRIPASFWLGVALGAGVVTMVLLPFALH